MHLLLCVGCGFLVHRLAESDTVHLPLPGTPLFIVCTVAGVLATALAVTATVRDNHAGVLEACAISLTGVVMSLSLALLVFDVRVLSSFALPVTTLLTTGLLVAVAVIGPPIVIIGAVKRDRNDRRRRAEQPTDLPSMAELATSPPTRPETMTPGETIPRGFRGLLLMILEFLVYAIVALQKLYTVAAVLFLIYIVWTTF